MNTKDNYGLIRIVAASPEVKVADIDANVSEISARCHKIEAQCRPSVICFPELSLTGYTCEEMFNQHSLYSRTEEGLNKLLELTADCEALIVVGLPLIYNARRFNSAAVLRKGRLLGIVPKTYLPNNAEFYEMRYFESATALGSELVEIEYAGCSCPFGVFQIFDIGKARIGIEICQDLWVPIPPSSYAALSGANIILNLSASDEMVGKHEFRKTLLGATSGRLHCAYVYASSGYGESSDDLVWGGSSLIYEDGALLSENRRFEKDAVWTAADVDLDALDGSRLHNGTFTLDGDGWPDDWPYRKNGAGYRHVDCGDCVRTDFDKQLFRDLARHPFFPGGTEQIQAQCREAFEIQVRGLITRLDHIHCGKCVIGISGGLDSTLALLVVCEAFDRMGLDRKGIIAITMPAFGTSSRTHENALTLMRELGVSHRDIDISHACILHMKNVGIDPDVHNTAYENAQARERTQVLMDTANNEGGIVVGTGDLSELALGWCTYNGDHMSMYGVNAGVPKTMVKEITLWRAQSLSGVKETILDIVDTPVSPELVPGEQKTEDLVGPYELHDFFLWHFYDGKGPEKIFLYACHAFGADYERDTILHWLKMFYRRFFSQQFKRSCLPNGPKICKVSLSPRGDWRMSTDTRSSLWQNELDSLQA